MSDAELDDLLAIDDPVERARVAAERHGKTWRDQVIEAIARREGRE